jgi:transcriptional regulator with XRE-family HTH domain
MPSLQLSHHLRANRKRLALSQEDVAFLLGADDGAQVSKYEHFGRTPTLETALAYEVITKRSMSELFGGMYQDAEEQVAERARVLLERTEDLSGERVARKREVLADLAGIND